MKGETDDDDLLKTFIGVLKSDEVVTLGERVYEFVRRGRNAAISFISEDEEEVRFNLDALEAPNTEIRIVEKGSQEPPLNKINLDEDIEVVELNFSVLEEEERAEVVSKIEDAFEKQGRFFNHEQERGYEVAERAKNDPEISEILETFGFLESQDKRLLRRGLSIRKAWEDESRYISQEQMAEWKGDLEKKFGEEGSTVANFCSSGYYDPDGVMQIVMGQIQEEYDDIDKIRSLYHDILENQPFVVYVGGFDKAWDTNVKVREKVKQHDSYPYEVPFVDLRAQGYRNRKVAEQAIEYLRDTIPDSAIETLHSDKEFVFRINPDKVGDLKE